MGGVVHIADRCEFTCAGCRERFLVDFRFKASDGADVCEDCAWAEADEQERRDEAMASEQWAPLSEMEGWT